MTKRAFALFTIILCALSLLSSAALADQKKEDPDAPLVELKNETLSYFSQVTGQVASVEGTKVKVTTGSDSSLKTGMRLNAIKEGVDFIHPVTKEPMGKLQSPVGKIEITEAGAGILLSGKPEDIAGAKVKMPATKIRTLFFQGTTDWHLGDAYYQMLKETGRFELVDTAIEKLDLAKLKAEAKDKSAEVIIILDSVTDKGDVKLTQQLVWADDAKQFSEKTVPISAAYVKELRFRTPLFAPGEGEILLSYTVSSGVNKIVAADVNGDRTIDIVLVTHNNIAVYNPDIDLKLLWEFKLQRANRILWIDALDFKNSGKDCLLIAAMEGDSVNSYIYEFNAGSFTSIWKANDTFIRKLDNRIITQPYTKSDGYDGDVRYLDYKDGKFTKGDKIKLPENVNIYDFQFVRSHDNKAGMFAWDENGVLHLFNQDGIRTWSSEEDFGGFAVKFNKEAISAFIDRGKWSVKDRLLVNGPEVMVPKRKPVLGMAKGLGYNSTEIRSMWWNGFSVENRKLIEEISGDMLDYAIVGDRIYTVNKSSLGFKPGNILKGESPFANMLYIFSLKGRR
ncbi:MAG: VCBS repeat-containing protein [Nitrospiraceae bacterium]|nr:VCBS repeat-containing protein [Nitrospiraceae bacterium]